MRRVAGIFSDIIAPLLIFWINLFIHSFKKYILSIFFCEKKYTQNIFCESTLSQKFFVKVHFHKHQGYSEKCDLTKEIK